VVTFAARTLTLLTSTGHDTALLIAAASQDSGDGLVKAAIVTGVFGVIVSIVGAVAVLFRARNPDLSELLALHERVAVNERNIADMHDDVKTLLQRTEPRRGR
jgi:hypothetical protein